MKIVDAQLSEMATQMSALDEFVTRARSQNEQSHNDHLTGLLEFQLEFAQLQSEVADSVDERDTALHVLSSEVDSNRAELNECISIFGVEAKEALQTMQQQMKDTNMQDYKPTGETPQKREWSYPSDLPATANHQSIIARMRGLPDPSPDSLSSRTPGRSPKKTSSPRKSPAKPRSPTKGKVYTDGEDLRVIALDNMTEPIKGLKEVDMNVIAGSNGTLGDAQTISFSRSVGPGQQPPLKRHATVAAVAGEKIIPIKSKIATAGGMGIENFGRSIGGGRRLRSSPPQ